MVIKSIRSKIVMLPTKDKNALIVVHQGNKMLGMNTNSVGYTKQYLYFTTDEKIKEGDWVLDMYNQKWKLLDNILVGFNKAGIRSFSTDNVTGHLCKKIVATTNTSLLLYVGENYTGKIIRKEGKNYQTLPQPSQAFIKKYIELGGIDEVDLEYEDKGKYISEEFGGMAHDTWIPNLQLKVNSHNIITIHAIKNSWNREEIIKLMEKYCIDIHKYTINSTDFNNWIKENL